MTKLEAIAGDGLLAVDRELAKLTEDAFANPGTIPKVREYIQLQTLGEGGSDSSAAEKVKSIKSSPLFRDDGSKKSSNWLAGAIDRLANIRFNLPKGPRSPDIPRANLPWLAPLVWSALGAALITFLIYAVRFINISKLRKRKAKAMLEEDEPERTLDEWLSLADSLAASGNHREAVRALYLACLLKFDENNVARFVRGQTNWEHLARIEGSSRMPSGLDFRNPTKRFDHIWYGHHTRGAEDVDEFRGYYQTVTSALGRVAA